VPSSRCVSDYNIYIPPSPPPTTANEKLFHLFSDDVYFNWSRKRYNGHTYGIASPYLQLVERSQGNTTNSNLRADSSGSDLEESTANGA
jgi:hypothetical protein